MPLPSVDFWYGVLITTVFAFGAYWFGVRRRKLTITHRLVPMIPKGGEKLAVTWEGEAVPEPVLVQLDIESSGAGDIAPTLFEGGGIHVALSSGQAIGSLVTEDAPPTSVSDDRLIIEPFLLERGKSRSANFLVSGERVELDASASKLADVTVAVRHYDERRWRLLLNVSIVYLAMALVAVLIGIFAPLELDYVTMFGLSERGSRTLTFLLLGGLMGFASVLIGLRALRALRKIKTRAQTSPLAS